MNRIGSRFGCRENGPVPARGRVRYRKKQALEGGGRSTDTGRRPARAGAFPFMGS